MIKSLNLSSSFPPSSNKIGPSINVIIPVIIANRYM